MASRWNEIINALAQAQGHPVLLCAPAGQQTEITTAVYEALRDKALLNPTGRNHTDIVHMSLYSGDEAPDRFSSLVNWARALFLAAGYRDQFEGLVMLNIAGVTDKPRLRAVAEGINRWCKRCYVLLYGYEEKNENLMTVIDTLDLYGTLRVACAAPERSLQADVLAEIDSRGYNISLTARKRLAAMLEQVHDKPGFTAEKYFTALGAAKGIGSTITEEMLQRITDDPYSYHNRLGSMPQKKDASRRRIGFGADDGAREASGPVHK